MSKWRRGRDPHAAREAAKYERPIPSREHVSNLLAERGVPLSFNEIAVELGLDDKQDRKSLKRRLRAMQRDGQLIRNRREGFGLVSKMDLVCGRVWAHAEGYGFLIPDDASDDLYLSPREMRSLMHGDRAMVRVIGLDRRGRKEGALVEVLKRNTEQVVGRFFQESGFGTVVPDSKRLHQDVLVPKKHWGPATNGQIVVVEITEQPSKHTQPIGRVVEVLGDHMAPGMEIDIAIRSHGISQQWPDAVEAETARFKLEVPKSAKRGRVDLRDIPFVTIDGADAKDFDDAVYCERKPNGWKLLVAIAHVSAYVQPGSALDAEAKLRGNSVYFPGRVIPMLPEILSNGLCSLNPDADRLCVVCEMSISLDGEVSRSRFFEGIMRSKARLIYEDVAAMVVDADTRLKKRHVALVPHLDELYAMYGVMKAARERRGAIEFDTTETKIVFDRGGKIDRVEPLVRNDAHRIIEECMVAANLAAARFLRRHKMPTLYRVHPAPTPEKLSELRTFLGELALRLGGGDEPQARHYSALLRRVSERADAHLIETVLLRSLAQALYSPNTVGHFGLALAHYVHFTSPIRRYPDLIVHRAICHVLKGGGADEFGYSWDDLLIQGDQCSMTERRADEATRDAINWLKCEFVMSRVGEIFRGTVAAVTSFGLFVELDDVYVEGLLHVTALGNDYYHFDPVHHRLQGERTGKAYRIGDRLTVRVVRVNLDERKVDLEFPAQQNARHPKPKRRVRRR